MPMIGQQCVVTFEKQEMLGNIVRSDAKTTVVQLPHGHGTVQFDNINVKLVPITTTAFK